MNIKRWQPDLSFYYINVAGESLASQLHLNSEMIIANELHNSYPVVDS